MILERSQLTERQDLAWKWALGTEKNLLISGFAGTGKTALILRIQADLEKVGRKVAMTAFTGIAAQKIEGTTTAKLLGLGIAKTTREIESVNWEQAQDNLAGVTDVLLDEVSVCSGDFLELVDQVLRRVQNSQLPFGGLRMIFGGDFLQLPPVHTPNDPPRRWKWAFQYPPFRRCHGIFLNESMRQRDPAEIQLLSEFRNGIISEEGQKFLDSAVGRPLQNPAELHGTRAGADEINQLRLKAHPGSSTRYPVLFHPLELKEQLLSQVSIDSVVELKVGAPVILLENHWLDRYANGSQGTVTDLGFRDIGVRLLNGKTVGVCYKTWKSPMGEVEGLPVQLGWAATIHRAQGLTLNEVRADITRVWEPGQAYVALSRTPSLENFSLVQPVHRIQACPEVLEFAHQLEVNTV